MTMNSRNVYEDVYEEDANSTSASGEWIPFSTQSDPTLAVVGAAAAVPVFTDSIISSGQNSYQVSKKLGFGSFGDLYIGEEMGSKHRVAIKIESMVEKNQQLPNEYRIYQILGCLEGCRGFPRIHHFIQWKEYNVLIMELLGRNLEDTFTEVCKQQFSLKTILYIALQLIDRFEFIHFRKICYRDVKPENFLLGYTGTPNANMIHVVDFGLSNVYADHAGNHIAYREGKNLTGTARYMSINSHNGLEQSRRDDLESLAHVLIYFARKGQLPWSGLKAANIRERYRLIGQIKQETPIAQLCAEQPSVLADFLRYARNLNFDEAPDYPLIRSWFRNLFVEKHFSEDGHFEWTTRTTT